MFTPFSFSASWDSKVYAVQLQPMYDYEFFSDANPLRPEEAVVVVEIRWMVAKSCATWYVVNPMIKKVFQPRWCKISSIHSMTIYVLMIFQQPHWLMVVKTITMNTEHVPPVDEDLYFVEQWLVKAKLMMMMMVMMMMVNDDDDDDDG